MRFYKYLKTCREDHNITQEELVSALYGFDKNTFKHLDAVTLSRWERHNTTPNTMKQLAIFKYFQTYTEKAFPCAQVYSEEEIIALVYNADIGDMHVKSKSVVMNFPSKHMDVDELKIYAVNDVASHHDFFELNMDISNIVEVPFMEVSQTQFETWAEYPGNLFLFCEYKENFAGLFFTIHLKQDIFEKIMNLEMKKSDLKENDFASKGEEGSILLISLYAINPKVLSVMFSRFYAYLIVEQNTVKDIGVTVVLEELKKAIHTINLKLYKHKELDIKNTVESYRQSLEKVLATEHVIKMLFSE